MASIFSVPVCRNPIVLIPRHESKTKYPKEYLLLMFMGAYFDTNEPHLLNLNPISAAVGF